MQWAFLNAARIRSHKMACRQRKSFDESCSITSYLESCGDLNVFSLRALAISKGKIYGWENIIIPVFDSAIKSSVHCVHSRFLTGCTSNVNRRLLLQYCLDVDFRIKRAVSSTAADLLIENDKKHIPTPLRMVLWSRPLSVACRYSLRLARFIVSKTCNFIWAWYLVAYLVYWFSHWLLYRCRSVRIYVSQSCAMRRQLFTGRRVTRKNMVTRPPQGVASTVTFTPQGCVGTHSKIFEQLAILLYV